MAESPARRIARRVPKGPGRRNAGLGQLTLVEHALCPLDPRNSLRPDHAFEAGFRFADRNRHVKVASARIHCPLGLSAGDEFFLWGLLALTFAQPEPDIELHATPHFCLRQLGLIDAASRRGGRQYRRFAEALERLSTVRYRNDAFYDPIRAEHRKVSFGFLSYSLPLDPESSRAWRLIWDPLFFEFVNSVGGYFWFDLETYRGLDTASRRLFLFLSKVFCRRTTTPRLDVRELGVDLIGFASSLDTRDMKVKISRVVDRLVGLKIVEPCESLFTKHGKGSYSLVLTRGEFYASRGPDRRPSAVESPLHEPLRLIGFDRASAARLIRQYPHRILREWADITLAARERFGDSFFTRSPQAYLVDNLKNARLGKRTPPDWWHDVRKAEAKAVADRLRGTGKSQAHERRRDGQPEDPESKELLARVRDEMLRCFLAAGQPRHVAASNADRFAREHLRNRSAAAQEATPRVADILTKL